jgi:hypothetical protein
VNVVTRSGTNVRHGDFYGYLRDDSLNARNALSGTKLPMHQSQYGFSMGGPIVQNRTFYFANVEQRRLDQSGLTTISPGSVAAINARLTAVGYGGPLVATGTYESPVNLTNLLAKIDHQIARRDQLGVRYSLYDVTALNARGAGALSAPSASSGLDNLDQAVAVSNTLILSPRTVLETRAQVARGDLQAPPTDPIGPAVAIAGVATFGTLSSSPTGRVNTMSQVVTTSRTRQARTLHRRDIPQRRSDRVSTRLPRQLHVFVVVESPGRRLNNAGFTRRSAPRRSADESDTASTRRTSGRSARVSP